MIFRKNKESDWAQIRDNAKYQEIDILGEYSHLTWRISDFKKYNTEITKTIENLDRLVYLEEEFMGLVKYGKMFNNRMHFFLLTTRQRARTHQIIVQFIMLVITMRNRSVNQKIFLLVVGDLRMK